jgi:hypothetical protein
MSLTVISNLDLPSMCTVSDVRKLGLPAVNSLVRKENGMVIKDDCYKFIQAMIILLTDFFGTTWNNSQLIECSKDLYSNYHFWTIADWKLFCRKAKSMEYVGDKGMFGIFTPDKLMFWAVRYNDEWIQCSIAIQEHEHSVITKPENRTDMTALNKEIEAHEKKLSQSLSVNKAVKFWENYENEIKENGTTKNANG